MAQWVGQQSAEVVDTGSNPSLYLDFPTLLLNFETRIFLKPGWVPLQNYSALSDKNFSAENRDTTPSLTHKTFSISEIFWKKGGFPHQVFRFSPVRHIFVRQYRDAPSAIHENFRYQNFFETLKGSPTKFFGTVRQKKGFNRK